LITEIIKGRQKKTLWTQSFFAAEWKIHRTLKKTINYLKVGNNKTDPNATNIHSSKQNK
jgi:hypothetical protein